jgi:hypothetical protein
MYLQKNKPSFVKVNKKGIIIGVLVVSVTIGAAATSSGPRDVHYENLKVLPKNISSKDLQGIMTDDFEDGLGVTCGFCHAPAKDGHGLDFASDAKPEKEMARAMMRTVLGVNKEYFKIRRPLIGAPSLIVTCNTCHRGKAFPD